MNKFSPVKFHLCVASELKPILHNCSKTSTIRVDNLQGIIQGAERGVERENMKIKSYLSALFIHHCSDTNFSLK